MVWWVYDYLWRLCFDSYIFSVAFSDLARYTLGVNHRIYVGNMDCIRTTTLICGILVLCVIPSFAKTFPKHLTKVGHIRTVQINEGDTLHDLLKREDVGYDEILSSNPVLKTQMPEPGTALIIPSSYLIPKLVFLIWIYLSIRAYFLSRNLSHFAILDSCYLF